MGFIARISVALGAVSDNAGAWARRFIVDPGGGARITVPQSGGPGDDSAPLDTDRAVVVQIPRNGGGVVVGFIDTANQPLAEKGSRRLYARAQNGAVKCSLWLHSDGAINIENDEVTLAITAAGAVTLSNAAGSFEMATGGTVTINGVTIDTDGNIVAPGSVSALGVIDTTTNVTLFSHKHPSNGTAPTPGT